LLYNIETQDIQVFMTREAIVVAVGMVPFAKRIRGSVDTIAAQAVLDLFRTSDVTQSMIGEAYVGSAKGGSLVGQRALRFAGVATGIPIYNVENACASSAVAFQLAYRSVGMGNTNAALVVGVDQLSSLPKGSLPVQATEWDGHNRINNLAIYAMRAQRYLHETDATVTDLAAVSVKSRAFASQNPYAQHRSPTTVEEVLGSRPVADPLTLFQCSSKSDGAAAVVVMERGYAESLGLTGPTVLAAEVRSGTFSMQERDITKPDITARASTAAYVAAGMDPSDLDVVELHDAFSIAELLYTEELGLCPDGEGASFLASGASSSLEAPGSVVNPSGGLLSRGHPIGATGAAQIVELTRQLTGTAGIRQKTDARIGLAHVTGGGASGFDNGACAVTILRANL
jgi:acetyl-CoA acetyltransferase